MHQDAIQKNLTRYYLVQLVIHCLILSCQEDKQLLGIPVEEWIQIRL